MILSLVERYISLYINNALKYYISMGLKQVSFVERFSLCRWVPYWSHSIYIASRYNTDCSLVEESINLFLDPVLDPSVKGQLVGDRGQTSSRCILTGHQELYCLTHHLLVRELFLIIITSSSIVFSIIATETSLQ